MKRDGLPWPVFLVVLAAIGALAHMEGQVWAERDRLRRELTNARTALDLAAQATREHRKDCPEWQSGLCVPTALWFNYVASVQPK
jgi:hypothetical protein